MTPATPTRPTIVKVPATAPVSEKKPDDDEVVDELLGETEGDASEESPGVVDPESVLGVVATGILPEDVEVICVPDWTALLV